jgi:hypothetical protein
MVSEFANKVPIFPFSLKFKALGRKLLAYYLFPSGRENFTSLHEPYIIGLAYKLVSERRKG